MALTEDQRATLELLLEADHSYAGIATVLGIEESEIRSRAREAVAELGGEDLGDDEETIDLLLGQLPAGSIEQATERLQGDPPRLTAARRVAALLRVAFPAGSVPTLPRPGRPDPRPEPPANPRPEPPPDSGAVMATPRPEARPSGSASEQEDGEAEPATLDRGQKRLLAALFGAAFVVVAIVLGASGVFGSEEEPTSTTGEAVVDGTPATEGEQPAGDDELPDAAGLTRAVLEPVGGAEGLGEALFGTFDGEQPSLVVVAEGLEPTGGGEEYHVWLLRDDESALRLTSSGVDQDGLLEVRVDMPLQVFGFVVGGELTHIDVSRAPSGVVQQEVNRSAEQGRLQHHVGRSVLRGPITGPGLNPNAE